MEAARQVRSHRVRATPGFEMSRFGRRIIYLRFADDVPLTTHREVLRQCHGLDHHLASPARAIGLGQFSSTAGHALVQYLYAEYYELLQTSPVNPSLNVQLWELKAHLEISGLAQNVGLDGLDELAGEGIQDVACDLDVFTVLDAIQAAEPSPVGNSTWFPRGIRSYLEQAFEDPRQLLDAPFAPGDRVSLVGIIFECMLETYADKQESLAAQPPPLPQDSGRQDEAAPEAEPEPVPEPVPGLEQEPPPAVGGDQPTAWEGADTSAGTKTSKKGKEKLQSVLIDEPARVPEPEPAVAEPFSDPGPSSWCVHAMTAPTWGSTVRYGERQHEREPLVSGPGYVFSLTRQDGGAYSWTLTGDDSFVMVEKAKNKGKQPGDGAGGAR